MEQEVIVRSQQVLIQEEIHNGAIYKPFENTHKTSDPTKEDHEYIVKHSERLTITEKATAEEKEHISFAIVRK